MSNKIIINNYGSIPHLSTSKLTQRADKKISIGQEKILTEKVRDKKDYIVVTEKVDGTNVGIIKKDGALIPVTRRGYRAESSPFVMHKAFVKWMYKEIKLFSWLENGWRIVGEWCIQAHGTLYDITNFSPFVAFDIFIDDKKRLLYDDFMELCDKWHIPAVRIVHIGTPIKVDIALELLGGGYYGNPDKPEGLVYRCERNGKCEFLAKHVHAEKEDGKYLETIRPNIGGQKYFDMI